MRNVKSIIVRATIIGEGVVQFDGKDQKFAHNRSTATIKSRHDNVNYGKAVFENAMRTLPDGSTLPVVNKILKISADGLRHAIHVEEHPFHTPNIGQSAMFRIPYLANLGTIQRGYLITDTEERKKSCYMITSAVELGKAFPILEFHSRSGEKEAGVNEDKEGKGKAKDELDNSDTSLHARESAGSTLYTFTAIIDPAELSFISMSSLQDRRALIDNGVDEFRKTLSENLGTPVSEPVYVIRKGSAYTIPERGILLSEEQVQHMVADLIRKMASIHITKSQSGYAKVVSLYVKAVSDPLKDASIPDGKVQAPEGWTHVFQDTTGFDTSALQTLLESFYPVYSVLDFEDAKKRVEEYDLANETRKAEVRARNKEKKDKKGKKSSSENEEG